MEEGEIPHAQGQESPQFSEEQINAMRTRTMSCILLTKHKIYALQKELGPVLEGFSSKQMEQNALYRKIFAEMLEICYTGITDQEGTKVNLQFFWFFQWNLLGFWGNLNFIA